MISCRNDSGFTLIEISIVLVIIGLIVGGVLVGQDLIRASENRAIISEAESYKTSVNTFRTKYNAIPGDIKNATDYFGAKADCSDRTDFTNTCNGDGNGNLPSISVISTATVGNEMFLFWQHLARAGLVAGSFNGVEGTLSEIDIDNGINTPYSKIRDAAFTARNEDHSNLASDFYGTFKIDFGNYFAVGVNDGEWIRKAVVTPAQAYNIDKKIDDGKPAIGKFIARYWLSCTNAASYTDLNSDYNLTNNKISCTPQFIKAF